MVYKYTHLIFLDIVNILQLRKVIKPKKKKDYLNEARCQLKNKDNCNKLKHDQQTLNRLVNDTVEKTKDDERKSSLRIKDRKKKTPKFYL